MSAAMQREWHPGVEPCETLERVGAAGDNQMDPQREHRRALIRKIFRDYAPALKELANR